MEPLDQDKAWLFAIMEHLEYRFFLVFTEKWQFGYAVLKKLFDMYILTVAMATFLVSVSYSQRFVNRNPRKNNDNNNKKHSIFYLMYDETVINALLHLDSFCK